MSRAVLTQSSLSTFRACPRLYAYKYEYGLRRQRDDEALRVGSAFALAVEAEGKGLDVQAAIERGNLDAYEMALVAAMFQTHIERWADDPVEHVAAELEVSMPLVNPETGRQSPLWVVGLKIDRIVRLADGRLALREYKTTSRDFAPGSNYWTRLDLDAQLSLYVIGARRAGYDVATIQYDVTRRPRQRPLKATPETERKYVKTTGLLYANQRAADETPEEYAARVAGAMREDPSRYFARVEIARTDQDLEDFQHELWDQAQALSEAKRKERWYRNPSNCVSSTGRACDFLPICKFSNLDTRVPEGYRRVENVHEELEASPKQVG
jgi:hypothetical protein